MDREKVEHRELAGREVNGALPLVSWEIVIEQKLERPRKQNRCPIFKRSSWSQLDLPPWTKQLTVATSSFLKLNPFILYILNVSCA